MSSARRFLFLLILASALPACGGDDDGSNEADHELAQVVVDTSPLSTVTACPRATPDAVVLDAAGRFQATVRATVKSVALGELRALLTVSPPNGTPVETTISLRRASGSHQFTGTAILTQPAPGLTVITARVAGSENQIERTLVSLNGTLRLRASSPASTPGTVVELEAEVSCGATQLTGQSVVFTGLPSTTFLPSPASTGADGIARSAFLWPAETSAVQVQAALGTNQAS